MVDLMAPLMFGCLVLCLLLGYPVAFALSATGLLFGLAGIELGMLKPELLQALPERIFGIMRNDTLLAIPFFTLMGIVLEKSGMAEELLDTVGQLFGKVRGGVAFAVVLVGAVLGATTGIVAASVIAMGLISLPIMLRYGYSKPLACGVICAAGTLAQIVPPSLVLIVLGDVLGVPIGDMYKGALLPSMVLVGVYVLFVVGVCIVRPEAMPAIPEAERREHGSALYLHALKTLVPPTILIFLVLGSIFLGIATPTEGGAMGACGALILALIRRRLGLGLLGKALDDTLKLTAFVVFILIGSTIFALVFRAVDGDLWVEHLFNLVPGGVWGYLIVVNLLVFVLGCFIDFFEIVYILIPLLVPVANKLGIDLVWFGVMVAMTMQTSFLTPPFGFSLFYLRSVAPREVETRSIYKGIVPFVLLQLLMVAMLMLFPQMVLHDQPAGGAGSTQEAPGKVMDAEGAANLLDQIE